MVSGKPSDSVCARNACSHLVPAMKQDIASTEYGVIPAAVRSSPGTKNAHKRGIVRFCKGFDNILHDYTGYILSRSRKLPVRKKAADVFPEAGIQ